MGLSLKHSSLSMVGGGVGLGSTFHNVPSLTNSVNFDISQRTDTRLSFSLKKSMILNSMIIKAQMIPNSSYPADGGKRIRTLLDKQIITISHFLCTNKKIASESIVLHSSQMFQDTVLRYPFS